MFELPELDIDELPDMEEGASTSFVDLMSDQGCGSVSPLREDTANMSYHENCEFVRSDQKLWMKFVVTAEDIKEIAKTTGGLIAADVQEGEYCFDVESRAKGDEEIYYLGEFIGQYVEGIPRIYKKLFANAVIQVMVKQEILFEYEPGRFMVHPVFMAGLDMLTQEAMTKALGKQGGVVLQKEKKASTSHSSKSVEAKSNVTPSHLDMF